MMSMASLILDVDPALFLMGTDLLLERRFITRANVRLRSDPSIYPLMLVCYLCVHLFLFPMSMVPLFTGQAFASFVGVSARFSSSCIGFLEILYIISAFMSIFCDCCPASRLSGSKYLCERSSVCSGE